MEFPPPSSIQVELLELDREIAHRQAELTQLIERRTALTPVPQMPPPQGKPLQSASGASGAQVVLALGAVVLMAAVASFAGFVWPHLTLPLRTAALALLVAVLTAGALYAKPRLNALAEALAATAGVSAVVLTTWFYAASSNDNHSFGIGAALGLAALAVGVAAQLGKLQAWEWTSSLTAPVAALYMTVGVEHPYIVAFLAAGLFAVLAWKLGWYQMVWSSGALLAVALCTTSVSLHDHGAGYSIPFVVALISAALASSNVAPRPLNRNVLGAASINGVVAALVGFMLWGNTVVNNPTIVERLDSVALLLAFAVLAWNTAQTRRDDVVRTLIVLALVAASANLAPAIVIAATLLAVPLCTAPIAALVFSATLTVTAAHTDPGTLFSGDTPVWALLSLAVVTPTWAAYRAKDRFAALGGAVFAGAAAIAVSNDVLHLASTELIGVITAFVLAAFWFLARTATSGPVPSWWLTPALFSALGPATARSLEHTDAAALLRTSIVLLVGAGLIWYGGSRRLGGLIVAPGLCIALIAATRLLDAASHVPVWIPLVIGGCVLLAVGARFERLAGQGRRVSDWVATLE